ncbi:hypothetical protein M9458_028921, partial [Cirrhinus mrigala]
SRDRVVQSLEKELGVQAGQTQRLLLQKVESERHYGRENSDSVNNQKWLTKSFYIIRKMNIH